MEHVASIIPRAIAVVSDNDQAPASEPRRSRTLFDLVERFQEQEAQQNEDMVLPLNQLRMTPEQTIEVPGLGTHAMNDWSRKQASSLLGLRWDRWFENASPTQRAEEINRRLGRATEQVKVRTTRAVPALSMPISLAAAWERSMIRPRMFVPSSDILTTVSRRFSRFMTRQRELNGKNLLAAVSANLENRSLFAVIWPFSRSPYQEAVPVNVTI